MEQEENRDTHDSGSGAGEGSVGSEPDTAGSDEGRGAAQVVPGEALPDQNAGAAQEAGSLPVILLSEKAGEGADKNPLYVKLPVYDGPLELLLDLIKKNEMDIYDIQISLITRQYLEYLTEMKRLDLEVAGEFLIMAATLIYIKSRTLLPVEEDFDDEDGTDPREELIRKLIEYQAFKEAAKELGILETERGKAFTRQIADYYLTDVGPEDEQIDTFSANLFDLLSAFQTVLTRKGREGLHEVYEEIVSIEEKMADMKTRLIRFKRIMFSDLFRDQTTRNELIATFLALLELVRSKFAWVNQDKQFGEIVIEKNERAQPVMEGEQG